MSVEEVLTAIQELNPQDKRRVLNFLKHELIEDELSISQADLDDMGQHLDLALFDAHDAAETLLKVLQEDKSKKHE